MEQLSASALERDSDAKLELRLYEHLPVLYWWPVWLVGYIMAGITLGAGEHVEVGGETMWFHRSRNVGVIYLAVVFFVFTVTNLSLKGTMAVLLLTIGLAAAIVIALLGWWDRLFSLEQHLSVHMDFGFYVLVSSVLLVIWLTQFLVFDRMRYFVFRPGQMIERNVLGGGSRTYDTRGIAVHRERVDPFRHWTLGFGSGDLHITTTGAEHTMIELRNVLFVDHKLEVLQRLSAMSPDSSSEAAS